MTASKWKKILFAVLVLLMIPVNGFFIGGFETAKAADSLEKVMIGNFESDDEIWNLGLGEEVPGAKGVYVRDSDNPQSGVMAGKLSGDFSAGGEYVSIGRSFVPIDMQSLEFWIKTSDIGKIQIRLKDSTGQVHQQYITLAQTSDWQKVEVTKFDGGQNYLSFGGANDKVWHGPAQRVEFLLVKPRLNNGQLSGDVWIDEVSAMATRQEPLWESAIGSFENASDIWTVNLGAEFPGAKGIFKRDKLQFKGGHYAGKLNADFSDGGKYISLGRKFEPMDAKKLAFWVKAPDVSYIVLRVMDATGQTHQRKVSLAQTSDWQKVEIFKFNEGQNYISFGGANDRIWHGPAQRIDFLLEKSAIASNQLNGEIWLDNIILTAPLPDLSVKQVNLGNIFLETDPVAFQIATKGDTVSWNVYNHMDHKVLEGRDSTQDGLLQLDIPLQQLGYFTLALTAEQENQPIKSIEIPLARLSNLAPNLLEESPFGIAAHLHWTDRGWSADLAELIRYAGAGVARGGIEWPGIEKVKGEYSFTPQPELFMERLDEEGVKGLFVSGYSSPFYDNNATPYTDEGRKAFANYVDAYVKHYKDQLIGVQVYNEFNGGFGKRGNSPANSQPDYYFKLLKETYTTVKASNPDFPVSGMVTSGVPLGWMEEVFKLGGLEYLDSIAIHPYRYPQTPEGMAVEISNLQALIRKYNNGNLKPIWISEFGWPTHDDARGVDEKTQADYLVRGHVMGLSKGVERIIWYNLMNDGLQADYNEHNFGMIRNAESPQGAYTPKPAYVAYGVMTRELTGADFAEQENYGNDIMSYLFKKNGEETRVLWALEEQNVVIETGSPLEIKDIMGNVETFVPYQGKIYLTLSGEPQYVSGVINRIVKDDTFAIAGDEASAGQLARFDVVINYTGIGSFDVLLEVEGEQRTVSAKHGQIDLHTFEAAGVRGSGYRSIVVDVWSGNDKIGKLRHDVVNRTLHAVQVRPQLEKEKDSFQQSLNIKVNNFSKGRALTVKNVEWSIGDQNGIESWDVSVKPQGTESFKISLDQLETGRNHPAKIQVEFEDVEAFVYEGNLSFNPIWQGIRVIDGQMDTDVENQPATINLSQATVKMNNYGGAEDLSGDVWLHYDKDHLYLSAKVVDDVHYAKSKGSEIWGNDSIQFALAAGIPGESRNWYEYGISDTPEGPQIYRWLAAEGLPAGTVQNGKLQVSRDEDQKLTIYELALPWSELAGIYPARGEVMSFSLLVNDNDGNGRKGYIEWGSGIGGEKSPKLFRTMQWMYTQKAAPVVYDYSYTVESGQKLQQLLEADYEEDTLVTYEIVKNGTKGTAEFTNTAKGEFIYSPSNSAEGVDTFTYRVHNGYEYSNTAVVTITIDKKVVNPPTSSGGYVPGTNTSSTGELYLPAGESGEVSLGKLVQLVLSSGSTNRATQLTIAELKDAAGLVEAEQRLLSPVFELSSKPDVQLQKPAVVSIAFDPAKLGKEQTAAIWRYDAEKKQWAQVGGTVKDGMISAELKQLGIYAVFAVSQEGTVTETDPNKPSFTDVKGHWGQAEIEKAVKLNIVQGYSDQTFRPDQSVSRQELIVMLDRALQPAGDEAAISFTDQAKIGAWAKVSIAKAVQAGWLTGYTDGSFRPNAGISRAEMAVVLAKAAQLPVGESENTGFADDASIPAWAKSYITAAVEEGLLQGRGGNRFVASGVVTRAEAAIIAVKLLERMAE